MNKPVTPMQSVAGQYLESLAARGIDYVFANAGTDFAPLIEAIVRAEQAERVLPRIMAVPHENVAVSMAHGYYRMSGKPAAAMVHVTVGTANAVCGIMNAARDHVPLLLAAGRTPNTESGHAGSRDAWIHWGQDTFDQGGMLREYVKWDYELRSGQPVDALVMRALDIAMSEPRGPVYLTLPREVLGDAVSASALAARSRPFGVPAAVPSQKDIAKVADLIAQAEFPLILTSTVGRNPNSVARLAALAEEFAIAVGQPYAGDVNLPSAHPMNLGSHPREAIARADLILVMDCAVPWTSKAEGPGAGTKTVHLGVDPFFSRYPVRGFEADVAVAGSSGAAVEMLYAALNALGTEIAKAVATRRVEISAMSQVRTDYMQRKIAETENAHPIHPVWLANCINQVKTPQTVVINELGVPFEFLDLSEPRTYMTSSPAGGLGFGLGGALGARLASPDRNVIAVIGDGSYMFGNPTPAHYVARAENLPTLTVVANNQRWHAVHQATAQMYPEGAATQSEHMPLVGLTPSPDFEKTIEACGGHGERVEDPGKLPGALDRALGAVGAGTPALLNVITQPGR